ncbi:MAG: PIN domain-containing protein [archaeon]|nr:PIN domain-containing protein [archaeon]MCP8322286.1 PIN domain-containing protein [archaeon]
MSRLGKSIKRFVIDTNVFVAAVKPFSKPAPQMRRDMKTLSLLTKLITDEDTELIGNSRLVGEYSQLAEELNSKTSRLILQQLITKMKIIEVDEKALRRCKPYLPNKESADVIHATTCLQTKAVLITNDTDFNKIKESGIIKVWSIGEAIRKILMLI